MHSPLQAVRHHPRGRPAARRRRAARRAAHLLATELLDDAGQPGRPGSAALARGHRRALLAADRRPGTLGGAAPARRGPPAGSSSSGSRRCATCPGMYFHEQPERSEAILERKFRHVVASGAEVLVTENVSCLLQLATARPCGPGPSSRVSRCSTRQSRPRGGAAPFSRVGLSRTARAAASCRTCRATSRSFAGVLRRRVQDEPRLEARHRVRASDRLLEGVQQRL